jgi:hypothetical protein
VTADDDRIAYLSGDDVALPDDARDDLDALRDLLAAPDLWVEPDSTLEDRIVAAIATESAGTTTEASAAPLPASPDGVPAGGGRAVARANRRWSPKKTAWGAIAVAATVLVILGGIVAFGSRGPSRQQFSLALAPTGLVPGASGHASLTKTTSGWRIELDATGLPRLDGGQFYQAWLKNDAGVLVPVGTFNEGTNVTLWAGVSPVDFPTFSITKELADGNQASSGERVLVGTVSPRR